MPYKMTRDAAVQVNLQNSSDDAEEVKAMPTVSDDNEEINPLGKCI